METLWYRRNSDDCGSGDIEQTDKISMVEQDRNDKISVAKINVF